MAHNLILKATKNELKELLSFRRKDAYVHLFSVKNKKVFRKIIILALFSLRIRKILMIS